MVLLVSTNMHAHLYNTHTHIIIIVNNSHIYIILSIHIIALVAYQIFNWTIAPNDGMNVGECLHN